MRANSVVQTGPKIQLGGAKVGRTIVAYHVGIDEAVKTDPIIPAASAIIIDIHPLRICDEFMTVFYHVLHNPWRDILHNMKGYTSNIEKLSLENSNFRKVLYTDMNSQLVIMSLLPGEDIGEEIHDVDQFLRVEKGSGKAILDGVSHEIADGSAIIVPAGTKHNIVNSTAGSMKLYTLYTPPHHRDQVIHKTKAAAEADAEHFDGKTTE